ncbi:hypothetical protein BR93DRAFT_627820 [Coniochaeta sp. PMI_546]|nr:hypothetical protein BR93DRAFT_627820 [Coniochaeta sp. PMI_546]
MSEYRYLIRYHLHTQFPGSYLPSLYLEGTKVCPWKARSPCQRRLGRSCCLNLFCTNGKRETAEDKRQNHLTFSSDQLRNQPPVIAGHVHVPENVCYQKPPTSKPPRLPFIGGQAAPHGTGLPHFGLALSARRETARDPGRRRRARPPSAPRRRSWGPRSIHRY